MLVTASCDVAVVVDVLSFSTAVDVATARGAVIHPARWKDERAAQLAESLGAALAVGRSKMSAETPFSLSPASLSSVRPGQRIVLPSPNGATVALEAASQGLTVIAGCLRNAKAVATAATGRRVAVIAAGERWPNGALRPAVEDLLGAGAIIATLGGSHSPEAAAAAAAFVASNVPAQVMSCASGRELIEAGFAQDVEIATMLDASDHVPVLTDGAFGAGA